MIFQACVLAPTTKSEKKVRSILEGLCDSGNRQVHKLYLCLWHSKGEPQLFDDNSSKTELTNCR